MGTLAGNPPIAPCPPSTHGAPPETLVRTKAAWLGPSFGSLLCHSVATVLTRKTRLPTSAYFRETLERATHAKM